MITPSDREWSREVVTGLPDLGTAFVWPFDIYPEESNGDLLATTHDRLTPPSLFLIKPSTTPQLLKRAPPAFDAGGLVGAQHEAISSDGTRIPYVQVGPAGETGEAPIHLYDYGGSIMSRHQVTPIRRF